jgi:predicted Zn-dependent protease
MAVVAYLPTADSVNPFAAANQLQTSPFIISAPPQDVRWVGHVAAQLSKTAEPLVLVFVGEQSVHAPAIGFSRRSLSRPAVEYVLVDPVMPQIGGEYGDWPDAPVTVVLTDQATELAKEAALQSRLRGWTVTNEDLNKVLENY